MEKMGKDQIYKRYRNLFKENRYPLAFVDMDFLDLNINSILERAQDKKIRIASKSIRSIYMLKYIMEKSDRFQGIMSFSGEEALFLIEQGLDDILVAYPEVNSEILNLIAIQIKSGRYINLIVDKKEHIGLINKIAKQQNVKIPVSIDIDVSSDLPGLHFGVWRSSIRNLQSLEDLVRQIKNSEHVILDGIMGYEAQIAGVTDNVVGKGTMNLIVRLLKNHSIRQIRKTRSNAISLLGKYDIQPRIVNGGGTGSLESTTVEEGLTEVTAGSGFYNPHLFDNYVQFQHAPAAGFACAISRNPKSGIFTCAGGGYISSGSTDKLRLPNPEYPDGLKLLENEGAGEVQTPVRYAGKETLSIGDPIFFRHGKAGELCERFNELHLIRGDKIEEIVPTYRGQGKCFL